MKYAQLIISSGSIAIFSLVFSNSVFGQCAGCGADYNKADRSSTEIERIRQYDKPVLTDPIGNALIGGGVTGSMKGAAAGAISAARGAAIGTAIKGAKGQK